MDMELSPKLYYEHLAEMEKAQVVRLWDVFFLGPIMIYIGTRRKIGKEMGLILALSELGTIIFNGYNYLQIEEFTRDRNKH